MLSRHFRSSIFLKCNDTVSCKISKKLVERILGTSGNYTVKIRGQRVQVLCDMTSNPPQEFFSVRAYSHYADAGTTSGIFTESTRTYQAVRLEYDKCLLGVDIRNTQYSTLEPANAQQDGRHCKYQLSKVPAQNYPKVA